MFNTSGSTYLNRYEWAKLIADVFEMDSSLISPSKSTEVNLPAKRSNVKLNISKTEKILGRKLIDVKGGLMIMKKQKEGGQD